MKHQAEAAASEAAAVLTAATTQAHNELHSLKVSGWTRRLSSKEYAEGLMCSCGAA